MHASLVHVHLIVVGKFMQTHIHMCTQVHTHVHTPLMIIDSMTEVLHPSCVDVLNVILFILKDNSQVQSVYMKTNFNIRYGTKQ